MIKKNDNPLISIVITTFNRQDLLKQTLHSLLQQTITSFEIIVVDNYSTYDFFGLLKSFNDARIRGFQNPNNGVIGVNRNFGVSKAVGELISFCDDDDLWDPVKLEMQLLFLKKIPNAKIVCTGSNFINNSGNKITGTGRLYKIVNNYLRLNLIHSKYNLLFISYITHSSVLMHREVIEKVGQINENTAMNTIVDFEYYFRCSLLFHIFYIPQQLVSYRIHEKRVSDSDIKLTKTKVNYVILTFWDQLNLLQKSIFRLRRCFI